MRVVASFRFWFQLQYMLLLMLLWFLAFSMGVWFIQTQTLVSVPPPLPLPAKERTEDKPWGERPRERYCGKVQPLYWQWPSQRRKRRTYDNDSSTLCHETDPLRYQYCIQVMLSDVLWRNSWPSVYQRFAHLTESPLTNPSSRANPKHSHGTLFLGIFQHRLWFLACLWGCGNFR